MAYNMADLERELSELGWTINAQALVSPQDLPGQVNIGGYAIALISSAGETFIGNGTTRTDALRTAAENAGVIAPDQPHLH